MRGWWEALAGILEEAEVGTEREVVRGVLVGGYPTRSDLLAGWHGEQRLDLERRIRVEDVVERVAYLSLFPNLPRRVVGFGALVRQVCVAAGQLELRVGHHAGVDGFCRLGVEVAADDQRTTGVMQADEAEQVLALLVTK